jgi:P4 family phage/plasmid primase-like protien
VTRTEGSGGKPQLTVIKGSGQPRTTQARSTISRRRLTTAETNAVLSKYGIVIDKLPLDDAGHAKRMFNLAATDGSDLARRTQRGGGSWICFAKDMGIWSEEAAEDQMTAWAKEIGDTLLSWADTITKKLNAKKQHTDEDRKALSVVKDLISEGRRLRSSAGMNAVRNAARAFREHYIRGSLFDKDPDHIVVGNGVVDLRTGESSKFSPKYRMTRRIVHNYNLDAECPSFTTFLAEAIPDEELRLWLQVCLGYALTGHTREQALWMPFGPTGTGKSMLLNAVSYVFGDSMLDDGFAMPAPRGLFRTSEHHWADTSTLDGARLVTDSEYAEQTVIDTALIKMLTGETLLTINPKYGKHRRIRLTSKFWLMTNSLPRFKTNPGEDLDAIFRRLFIVPMEQQMYLGAYTSDAYRELPGRLQSEGEGILVWLIEGARRWYHEPLQNNVPAVVVKAVNEYRRNVGALDLIWESLKTGGFRLRPGVWTPTEELHTAVVKYHTDIGYDIPAEAKTTQWMRNQGLSNEQRRDDGSAKRGWIGIGR